MPHSRSLPGSIKIFLDILPLALFFVTYKYYGLPQATVVIIVATMVTLAIIYMVERTVALAPLVTALVVAVFGGLTLYLHDERFIKVKPTLINLVFALILLVGWARGKGWIQFIFGSAFTLRDSAWRILSLRYSLFFMVLAALNEYVWRNYSTDAWVNFKVFGLLGLTMLFSLSQFRFIHNNQVPPTEPET